MVPAGAMTISHISSMSLRDHHADRPCQDLSGNEVSRCGQEKGYRNTRKRGRARGEGEAGAGKRKKKKKLKGNPIQIQPVDCNSKIHNKSDARKATKYLQWGFILDKIEGHAMN